jgi:hypothetical protein
MYFECLLRLKTLSAAAMVGASLCFKVDSRVVGALDVIEARNLVVMLVVEKWRGAQLEVVFRLCVLLMWWVVRPLCLLLDCLRRARGICGAAARVFLASRCPAYGFVRLCCMCLLVMLQKLVHGVETDVAADVVSHVVGLHFRKVGGGMERGLVSVGVLVDCFNSCLLLLFVPRL